jgi:hypothetical protein
MTYKIVIAAVGLVCIGIAIATGASVFMFLWNTFLTRAFPVGAVSYPVALGLVLFLGLTKGVKASENAKKTDDEILRDLIGLFVRAMTIYAFTAGVGYIVSLFI